MCTLNKYMGMVSIVLDVGGVGVTSCIAKNFSYKYTM